VRRAAQLVVAAGVLALGAGTAQANTTTDCYFSAAKWGPAKTTVDVWMANNAEFGVQNLGISEYEAGVALAQAVAVWNEHSGAAMRLNYRGVTSITGNGGAITVNANPGADPFGNAEDGYAPGRTWLWPDSNEPLKVGQVNIVLYELDGDGSPLAWDAGGNSDYLYYSSQTGTPYRLLPVLVHELGHAAFQIQHPGVGPCTDAGQATVVSGRPYGQTPWPYRALRAWDKARAQMRMGRRSVYSQIVHRVWNPTTDTWGPATSTVKNVLYRMSSATQGRPLDTVLAWIRQDDPVNTAQVLRKESVGTSFGTGQSIVSSAQSTVATASARSGESIMAYLAHEDASTGLARICYRKSDTGETFGGETCLTNPFNSNAYFTTLRNTVTASYDPRSKTFLIGAIVEWNVVDGELLPRLFVQTLPAQGSTTPAAFKFMPTYNLSFNAPSIACRNAANGCRIFYQDRTLSGTLRWIESEVDLVTGQMKDGVTRSANWMTQDTPDVVWSESENRYRVAYTISNSSAYTYALTATGTTLTGVGDLSNNGSFISAPVQSTVQYCAAPFCAGEIHGWFVKWW
jgi:hypothetical protein